MIDKTVVILTLITPLLFTSAVKAENPEHVEQLLTTRECYRCDLSGANLSEEHLIGADLREANLEGANLTHANLEGADLTGANLQGAHLTGAHLTDASLNDANLNNVNFSSANIYSVDVSGASMVDIVLTDANVHNTAIGVGGGYMETDLVGDPEKIFAESSTAYIEENEFQEYPAHYLVEYPETPYTYPEGHEEYPVVNTFWY
ncbi:MAG: pentapeptide repeat-containing protein [Hormoscilla sp. GM7CHS1pb]|nr:pentapeptide repeat-containing protein [Hormoscilla sp. GM7CHS1pb]